MKNDFTLKQKLFLCCGVPLLFFGLLEGLVRVFSLDRRLAGADNKIALEMPAWMLNDANAVMRARRLEDKRANIDWLNIFEEGDGFRVRLIPNSDNLVTNSFSLIPYELSRKYRVRSNSLGFRGPELSPKKPAGIFRILIFGDSSSFGWGVNNEETFGELLAARLKAATPKKIEVGNFALPGDSSEYGRLIAEKYIPRVESDMIIFGFGANDAKKTYVPHNVQVSNFRAHTWLQKIKYWAAHSALYRALSAALTPHPPAGQKKELHMRHAVKRKRYVENLEKLAELARQNGAQPALINLCTPSDYAAEAEKLAESKEIPYFNGQAHLTRNIARIKAGEVYPALVDEMKNNYKAELDLNSTLYVTSDGCHPNKLGHVIVADELAAIVKPFLEKDAR